jgi:signal transduction histidine kinase
MVGDRYLLQIAFGHLLANALKFSPAGGTVSVHVERSSDHLKDGFLVDVTDAGPGIPESERQRILDRFEQGGDLMTSKPAGLGLGLAVVREIAERHGGTLELSCPAAGGTVATLHLTSAGRSKTPLVPAFAGSVDEGEEG